MGQIVSPRRQSRADHLLMDNPNITVQDPERMILASLRLTIGKFDIGSVSGLRFSLLSSDDIREILCFVDLTKQRLIEVLDEVEAEDLKRA